MEDLKTSVILFAHGSKAREANEGIAHLAEDLESRSGYSTDAAFLEVATPNLGEAVSEAIRKGARRIIVLPCFLTMGMHVRQDLPRLVAEERAKYPRAEIVVSPPLEGHPGLIAILLQRVQEALRNAVTQERT